MGWNLRHAAVAAALVSATTALLALGCRKLGGEFLRQKPSQVVEAAYLAANAGRYSEVEQYLASDAVATIKSPLGVLAGGMKGIWDKQTHNGTIERIEILREDVRGEGAEVTVRLHFKDHSTERVTEPLILEGGLWKLSGGQ